MINALDLFSAAPHVSATDVPWRPVMKRSCTAPVLFAPTQVALAVSTTPRFAWLDHPGMGVGREFLARAIEVLAVMARASTAAHYYEELIRFSDHELAARGLKRADVARAAFHCLAAGKCLCSRLPLCERRNQCDRSPYNG